MVITATIAVITGRVIGTLLEDKDSARCSLRRVRLCRRSGVSGLDQLPDPQLGSVGRNRRVVPLAQDLGLGGEREEAFGRPGFVVGVFLYKNRVSVYVGDKAPYGVS